MRPATYFAPPERADFQTLAEQYRHIQGTPLIAQLLNGFLEPAMVLNGSRQVVFANDKLLASLNKPAQQVIGFRPGEIFRCIHAWECEGGCGTSRFCPQCGAAGSIVAAIGKQTASVAECRLTANSDTGDIQSLDLRVISNPVHLDGENYVTFAIQDITDEKRRAILERLFFHDILNAAGGLKGLLDMTVEAPPDEAAELTGLAGRVAGQLVEEIQSFRDLTAAERGDLQCTLTVFDVAPVLAQMHGLYRNHPVAEGKRFPDPCISGPGRATVYSDEHLLSRVIGNLLKNAFEAAAPGTAVEMTFQRWAETGGGVISVHNEGWMTPQVQMQIFQRSFSTKAASGRGLGTYSVKLLTERYLKGEVRFTSSRDRGTTFSIVLPAPPAGPVH